MNQPNGKKSLMNSIMPLTQSNQIVINSHITQFYVRIKSSRFCAQDTCVFDARCTIVVDINTPNG